MSSKGAISRSLNAASLGLSRQRPWEGQAVRAKIFFDIRDYHLSTDEVGRIAADAGVKTLILTHFVPATDDDDYMNLVFRDEVAKYYDGEFVLAEDGTEYVLP